MKIPTLALLCCQLAWGALPFDVRQDGAGGLTVAQGGTLLLNHTKSSPMMFVGKGRTSFPEHSGNFDIQDYTQERVGLALSHVMCSDTLCTVNLTRGDTFVGLEMTSSPHQTLRMSVTSQSSDWDRIWIRMPAEKLEEVWGGGEQFSYFNLRHRDGKRGENVFPIWTREQGVGRNKSTVVTFMADAQGAGGDYHTTYFPQPSFISSRGFSFHHGGDNYAVLDFSQDDFHEVFILGKPEDIFLNARPAILDLVTDMTSLLGRMPSPPSWLMGGAVLGVQGGTATMLDRYRFAKQHHIPVSALWIQDWSGKQVTPFGSRVNWNWRWDPTWYPELDTVIKNLTKEGVKVFAYINPNLDHRGDLFKEAASKGYLVRNATGGVYYSTSLSFVYGTVDLTNPRAYSWYKDDVVKKNMIDLGLGGWMADFGEYLPADAVLAGGRGVDVHNAWPRLWAELNRAALEETGKVGEVVFFSRSGFSGVSNFSTLMWAGDQNVDFSLADGLHSAILGSLSMALVGGGLTHWDIGGYTTFGAQGLVRTEELLLRSAEVAAFTPVFRTHEGNQPGYNVQWYSNTSTIMAFSRLARVYQALGHYREAVTSELSSTGAPAMRPLQLYYPGLNAPYTQYLLGHDILVCPVYLSHVTTQDCVLPPTNGSTWVHFWTLRPYTGGQTVTVPAPLGSPPVFYRSESSFKAEFEAIKDIKEMQPLSLHDVVG